MTFTDDEKAAIRLLKKTYPQTHYIGRDGKGSLYLFCDEPQYAKSQILTSTSINRSRRIELPCDLFPLINCGDSMCIDWEV